MKTSKQLSNKYIAWWLGTGIIMLIIQIVLGGITRLTGSGLSITEWQLILGAFPPMSDAAWKWNFELYQHIAQFKKINNEFALGDYKMIFFWEWLHRDWARLMGLVFIIPFLVFLWKKMISKALIRPLVVLFLLGGLQGAIGWIMVESGLNDVDVAVSHIRLAVHFIFALFLLAYLLWFFLRVSWSDVRPLDSVLLNRLNIFILVLVFIQLTYGAFMAGTHAALYAPTWPDINGAIFPKLLRSGSLGSQLIYDPLLIQFIHRTLAYLIGIAIFIWFYISGKISRKSALYSWRMAPMLLVMVQIVLGVMALMNSAGKNMLFYSIAHQFTGMLLMLSLIITFYLNRDTEKASITF